MEEKIQNLPLILQKDTWCKMIIPESVEKKIRLLCREIHNIEWSGVLFYEVSGSFEEKNLTVTCLDIYQMDIGNGAYTEYTMNPSVASYMLDHDLLNAYQGHIHSHHNMSTFFSGTDTQELRDGGNDTNHFVSLIVNNEGTYTAAITRKITSKRTVSEEYSYKSFNDTEYKGAKDYVSEDSYLEWYKLNIEIQGDNQYEKEMMERIKELKESKNKVNTIRPVNLNTPDYPHRAVQSYTTPVGKGNQIQKELPFEEESDIPYGKIKIDDKLIQSLLKQLITCSVIIPNSSSIDLEKWSKAIPKLYSERFGTIHIFKEFAEPYVDFILNYVDGSDLPDTITDVGMAVGLLAYELQERLHKLPKNIWLDAYIEILDDYII